VLVYLVQHRDRVVSKAELLKYLWPQQRISETTLSQHLMLMCKAIDDGEPGMGKSRLMYEFSNGPQGLLPD
jgi:DNA-binding winged helix-turn-helix (wHTH) protein